jgi:hypothetical protein
MNLPACMAAVALRSSKRIHYSTWDWGKEEATKATRRALMPLLSVAPTPSGLLNIFKFDS